MVWEEYNDEYTKSDLEKWYDKDFCLNAVLEDPWNITFCKVRDDDIFNAIITNLTEYFDEHLVSFMFGASDEILLKAIARDPYSLRHIQNPTEEMCELAISYDVDLIQFIDIKKYPNIYAKYILIRK